MNKNLIIRTDAGIRMGTGHIMRCLALAQSWQDCGGRVTFLSNCESEALRQRIVHEGFTFIPIENSHPDPRDIERTLSFLSNPTNKTNRTWLALDGYHFTPDYQKTIKGSSYKLLVIDDMAHLEHYHADILLNQNIHASKLNYSCDKDTIQLLGCNYVMLRREFLKYRNRKRELPEKAKNILVTLGGGDPDNVTLKVIKAIQKLSMENIEVKVVVGPSNPHITSLKEALNLFPFPFSLLSSVKNMPELMAWADVAVTAGGSTCWELAFMGLLNVILILAENQREIAEMLNEKGLVVNLGWYEGVKSGAIARSLQTLIMDKKSRAEMSRRAQKLVDGAGSERVVRSMMRGELTLRPVQEEDCEMIWKWANDPDARAVSFFSETISWNDHVRWFKSKLNDPCCIFFIINKNETPVGQVRFDKNENEPVISVSIDHKFRGSGYGSMIIKLASQEFFNISGDQVIHAYIKQGNEKSRRAFVKARFTNEGVTVISGQPAIHLRLRRNDLA